MQVPDTNRVFRVKELLLLRYLNLLPISFCPVVILHQVFLYIVEIKLNWKFDWRDFLSTAIGNDRKWLSDKIYKNFYTHEQNFQK